jgi:23S rRNA pseudouridine1911/1915/1917 synthase
MNNYYIFTAKEEEDGKRLDVFLAEKIEDSTRSLVQQWIEEGAVSCELIKGLLKPSLKIKQGQIFTVVIPKPVEDVLTPLHMDLDIFFEDEHLLVLNKPAGLIVHPGAGHFNDTLVNGLLYHCKDLSGIGGVLRPGIVHRLDKDTSGLMVVAKHDKAHHGLSLQFQKKGEEGAIKRQYVGFCFGSPLPLRGRIETQIGRHPKDRQRMTVLKNGGKESVTLYETKNIYKKESIDFSEIEFTLLTGRTHQIRVHCQYIKTPLIGDPVYGASSKKQIKNDIVQTFKRQALHAKRLAFTHPITNKLLDFESSLPLDMVLLKEALNQ